MRLILMAAAAAMIMGARAVDPGPPGASVVFTSQDPVAVKARALIAQGRLSDAEAALKDPQVDPRLREEGIEIVRRTRQEYNVDGDAMLRRVRDSVPDATAADLERWRVTPGSVQFRTIDGEVRYWNREPSNLFKFCEDARQRREKAGRAPAKSSERKLTGHIQTILQQADATGKIEVVPLRHKVRYAITVQPDRPGAKKGSLVRCWLPFPQEYRQQKDVKLLSSSPSGPRIAPAGVFKAGTIEGAPQRTVYFEQTIDDPSKPVRFEEEFEYVSYAYCPKLDDAAAKPLPEGWTEGMGERLPHIALTPAIRAEAEREVGDERNPLARARKIYLHLCNTLRYAYEEEYTVIPSIALRTFERRRGDCGAQSMLFIAMCRAVGIPARWQSGWETQPWDSNMHDWAEFYVEPWGWLPADVSYGLQQSDDSRVREFYFGHQDAYRLIVNLDYGRALQPEKKSLRSEPADFQRGEVEIDGRNLYFDEWRYRMSFDASPVE